jgi:hypothetical protein
MMLKGDYIPNTKFHFKIFLLPLCRARKEERKHYKKKKKRAQVEGSSKVSKCLFPTL